MKLGVFMLWTEMREVPKALPPLPAHGLGALSSSLPEVDAPASLSASPARAVPAAKRSDRGAAKTAAKKTRKRRPSRIVDEATAS